MEQTGQATSSASTNSNSWVLLLLGAVGIYLLFRNKSPKKTTQSTTSKLDNYSKFRSTPMGQSIDDQLVEDGIELSSEQIKMLDECLKGLSEEEYKIIEKASQFSKKEDLYKALDEKEMKMFVPIRKKIMQCLDDVING